MNEEYRKGYQAGYAAGMRSKPLTDMSKVIITPMKTGNWVGIDDYPYEDWECNACGFLLLGDDKAPKWANYCPNCGARMENKDE